jgi:hypothetical protein
MRVTRARPSRMSAPGELRATRCPICAPIASRPRLRVPGAWDASPARGMRATHRARAQQVRRAGGKALGSAPSWPCDWIPYPSCLRHGLSSQSGRATDRMGCTCDIATLDLRDGGVTMLVHMADWMSPGSSRPEPDINLIPTNPSYRSMPVKRISVV